MTKTLVGCERIHSSHKKISTFLKAMFGLRAKISLCGFANCSEIVCSTRSVWADADGWHFLLGKYNEFVKKNISWKRKKKNVLSALVMAEDRRKPGLLDRPFSLMCLQAMC
jgi:hypothetical protein